MADQPDLIIIGAGLAGLSAGVYAALNGYSTVIYEHHTRPGGVVATWKRGDYIVEGGMHFLMGYRPGQPIYDLYRETGVLPDVSVIPMNSYMKYVDAASGRTIELSGGREEVKNSLAAASPADVRLIEELFAGAAKLARDDFGMGLLDKAPELMTLADKTKMLWDMRNGLRYYSGRFAKPMTEYTRRVKDPFLKKVLRNAFMPESPAWFVMMLFGIMGGDQIGLLENGSLDFAEHIAGRFKSLGGKIVYRSTVAEIITEDDRAVGVRLANGTEHRASAVIAAGDGHSTIYELLRGYYVDEATEERFESWPLTRPFVMVNYGMNRTFPDEAPFGIYLPKTPLDINGMEFDMVGTRVFNYTNAFAPAGKTLFQAYLETTWDEWNIMREDKAEYDMQKKAVALALLDFFEPFYPGIADQVEMTDVATPYTMWRYTRNWKGAYEGWLPSAELMLKTIPRTLPGLRGLYLAGQWVVPGGGVPISMYSGKHAVQLMCKQDKKPFSGGPK